ncbi:MAG: maleylpyruvate isomerase N-terminal domain-containing protein [Pseudonocardiaceae bacterium]
MSIASPAESRAFMAALDEVEPDAATACADWTAHDLVAHLAAGAQEKPELTRHAVDVLNTLPVLAEAPGARADVGGLFHSRVVLRSPDQPDVVLIADTSGARFELIAGGPANGDAVVATDAVNRLLTLWGRRSSRREITITADPGSGRR